MNGSVKTDFLFAQPSLASGMARVFDLWGGFDTYNQSETATEADEKAIASDWFMIGNDLQEALNQDESELDAA